jgi:monomeric sarcosine oxidase
MHDTQFDCIVIGAGGIGSAAALHAARDGQRTLLLEQFALDHDRGSSHGASRIIRYAYDHPVYIALARAAFAAWRELEAESGESLMLPAGGLDLGPADAPSLQATVQALAQTDIAHTVWGAAEAMQHFPQFHLPEDWQALYQADSAVLRASQAVRVQVRLAQAAGAQVLADTAVQAVAPVSSTLMVQSSAGRFEAARVIVAAGAWANHLLRPLGFALPLQPVLCQENYFEAEPASAYEIGRFPIFIAHVGGLDGYRYAYHPYGLPSIDGSGVKVSLHGGPPFEPDTPDRTPIPAVIEASAAFGGAHLNGFTGRVRSARACLYTMTPDTHFVLDCHPEYPNLVVSASCSGHAFKFAPVLGQMACQLATDGHTRQDRTLFRASRFDALPA